MDQNSMPEREPGEAEVVDMNMFDEYEVRVNNST